MKQVKHNKTHTGEYSEYQASKHTAVLNLCVLKKKTIYLSALWGHMLQGWEKGLLRGHGPKFLNNSNFSEGQVSRMNKGVDSKESCRNS